MTTKIILASSSPYRKTLLEKLQIKFTTCSPNIDETIKDNEPPRMLVERLSLAKAEAIAQLEPEAIIIASDQIGFCQGSILCKPRHRINAIQQLMQQSNQTTTFYTGLAVMKKNTNFLMTTVATTEIVFKKLELDEASYYVDHEDILDCAGSFKSEGLGIALFKKILSDDPNSIIGLPLIKLIDILKKAGVNILAQTQR